MQEIRRHSPLHQRGASCCQGKDRARQYSDASREQIWHLLCAIFSSLRTHLLEDDLEPRHEGAIRQSASDVGRSTPSVREEPRDTQMVGRGCHRGRAVPQRRTRSKIREPDVRPVSPHDTHVSV